MRLLWNHGSEIAEADPELSPWIAIRTLSLNFLQKEAIHLESSRNQMLARCRRRSIEHLKLEPSEVNGKIMSPRGTMVAEKMDNALRNVLVIGRERESLRNYCTGNNKFLLLSENGMESTDLIQCREKYYSKKMVRNVTDSTLTWTCD